MDHPSTLISAGNLAISLRQLGEYQRARELDEDTLARFKRVLGEDHPDTVIAASNLAAGLRYRPDPELDEDTHTRRQRASDSDDPEPS
ncbi:tetratricopeptide repeat protein [Amycolatopsis sp. FBCC-B4732]|uniref:tetratricopeptide repeat protein n=1 Tax=Amycolatopsis sp. FBCC-B4732 TaxID=3079339 RepID=UPI001FF2F93D|nr:tetratricopeptide repeat protein [Amycolatopsis sp. FBCC-B4732]UOX88783.1 tetratricopeptide repeat protein [Amycolatopsis sp. FBCC-B4732]